MALITVNSEELVNENPLLVNKDLGPLLAAGYKKIFFKQKCFDEYRRMNLKWVSPYKPQENSEYFFCKENKYRFFGNIKEVFYNPRYAEDRLNLVKKLETKSLKDKTSLCIVGSGISPYTVYLSSLFKEITEYEINPEAHRYGLINKTLNGCTHVKSLNEPYKNDNSYDYIVSVVPAGDLSFHKKYNFNDTLITYVTANCEQINPIMDSLKTFHNCDQAQFKIVRPYCKNVNTYRLWMSKPKKCK